jgi:hypothetical protein
MISNSLEAIQPTYPFCFVADFWFVFCRFLNLNIPIHPAKLSDNIMLGVLRRNKMGRGALVKK